MAASDIMYAKPLINVCSRKLAAGTTLSKSLSIVDILL